MDPIQHRLLSRPVDVHWAGWRSTTLHLQQAGWEISADQDIRNMAIRIAFRHKDLQCVAVSNMMEDFRYDAYAFNQGLAPNRPLTIQYFASRLSMQIHSGGIDCMNFKPIDAAPQFISHEIKSIEDMQWFAAPLVRTEEIIVEPEAVQSMLDRIREMQAPEQSALRSKQRLAASREGLDMSQGMPRQKFHAQILSIAA